MGDPTERRRHPGGEGLKEVLDQLGLVIPAVGSAGPLYAHGINDALAKINRDLPWRVSRSVGDDTTNNTSALEDDYGALHDAGGGILFLKPGIHRRGNLTWDSNLVSVVGPGSALCKLRAVANTTLDIGLPTPLTTVEQGPTFGGFGVIADAAAPINTVGIKLGDLTTAELFDIVWAGFSGANNIGCLVDTAHQTELIHLRRLRSSDNKVGIKFTNSDPANNSLARWIIDLHLHVKAGQIGWQMRDEVIMYGERLHVVGNMDGAGTFFDIGAGTDNCGINGGHWEVACEQTSGSGGVPYSIGLNGYGFAESGFARFEGLGAGVVAGGPRNSPAWRVPTSSGIVAGVDDPVEGQVVDFLGNGDGSAPAANVHQLLWDNIQEPHAGFGVLTNIPEGIRCPYVVMFDSATSAFVVYKKAAGAPNNLTEVWRVTNHGHVITKAGTPATSLLGAAAGTGGSKGTSGNNVKGTASVGTGIGTTVGVLIRVIFANPWPVVPEVVLQPLTAACHEIKPVVVRAATYFEIFATVPPATSQPLGTYAWAWHALG